MAGRLTDLGRRILVSDGAMGTLLSAGSVRGRMVPEEALLSRYDEVVRAHRDYAEAGADLITTNTYGAGRMKLREFGLESRQPEIVRRAVAAAREGAGDSGRAVVGSIGPLGSFVMPLGPVETHEALSCFTELARLLIDAGVDALAIETMTDIRELRLAARAVRSVDRSIPLLMQMSFGPDGRTVTGTPPGVLCSTAAPFGPGACGLNCGNSLEAALVALEAVCAASTMPVAAQPNAGLPRSDGDSVSWPAGPGELAAFAVSAAEMGASLIGSCCGSTPDHTRAIRAAVEGLPVRGVRGSRSCSIASRTSVVSFGRGFVVIGEKINPTGRPRLAASVREGSLGILKRYALSQAEAGADAIDLNVGIGDPGLEASFMARAVRGLDNVTTLPFLIDSPVEAVLEAGLEEYPARPMINSIPCTGGRMERALCMARDHGAAFVALLMDEHGVPGDTAGRIRILERILAAASDLGISHSDILVDPVVMAESAGPGGAVVTIETIRTVSGAFGLPTVLGLSNVSFGLPARHSVNRAFLVLASSAGLSSAIMDAGERDAALLAGASGLLGAIEGSLPRLVSLASARSDPEREQNQTGQQQKELDLESSILSGSPEEAREAAVRELENVPAESFVLDRLVPAVTRLGRDYEEGRIFLPHLMAGADAVRAAFEVVRERSGDSAGRGTVLMATVEGDVHDIGKNIVSAVLAGHGWRVVDLGRNVPADRLVDAVLREAPVAVGLSALLTPSLPSMKEAVEAIVQSVPDRPVIIVGGAVVTPEFAGSLGVLWGRDAVHGAAVLDEAVPRAARRT